MILIGASSRKAGKTLLGEKIIHHLLPDHKVFAIKIALFEKGGERFELQFENGLPENFKFPEEFKSALRFEADSGNGELGNEQVQSKSDTSRFVKAGAANAIYLKVDPKSLKRNLASFLKLLPSDNIILCESTYLRKLLVPGAFLLAKNQSSSKELEMKRSDLLPLADFVVDDAKSFELFIRRLKISPECKVSLTL